MSTKKVAKIAVVITVLTLFGKFIGMFREVLLATHYGTTIQSDAYVMSQSIIQILTTLVVAALGTAFIPMLTRYKENHSKDEYRNFINNVYTITVTVAIIIDIVIYVFLDQVISVFAPGFSAEARIITKSLVVYMLPMIIISVIVTLNNSYLQVNGSFYIPALISYPSNLVLIVCMGFFSETFGILGLGVAATLGVMAQLLFQQAELRKTDFKYSIEFDINDKGVKELFWLILPTTVGIGIQQINATVDRIIGSNVGTGSVAALNFSNRLSLFILGIISASISSVLFSQLAKHVANKEFNEFQHLLVKSINTLFVLVIPASIGMIVLRYPIVKFVFERGKFDSSATSLTSTALLYLSMGLIGFSIRDVLNRAFYSLGDTMTPMKNGVIAILINIILSITLSKYMGIGGIAFAASFAGMTSSLLLFFNLQKKIGNFNIKVLSSTLIKVLAASLIMGVTVFMTYNALNILGMPLLVVLGASVFIGGCIYLGFIYMLKIEEFVDLVEAIKRKIRKTA